MRAVPLHLLLSILLFPQSAIAAAGCPSSSVFLDGNGNGRRDPREHGIPDVRVANGKRITRTDARGRFVIDVEPGQPVFVIKPAGFDAARRADGLPDTWSESGCRDFPLIRHRGSRRDDLEVLVFGDPQPKSQRDVGYYERDIVAPLRGRHAARLGISLGDLVNDDLSLYPALKAVDASLGVPWLHAPGNHDLNFDSPTDEGSLRGFRQSFGPDTYAWEEARANFIVLDDVIFRPGQSPAYVGGFLERQFQFLESYLAGAAKDRLLVLSLHIPLFDIPVGSQTFRPADRERLFALLQPFPRVLILSAHSHNQQHFLHGPATGWHGREPLHEYNVGAACGAYWSGAPDAAAIPASTMSDGTPNGYATLRVGANSQELRWHVARAADDLQIALHAPKVLRSGAYPAYGVYANVFMGHDDTPVEFRIDGGPWKPMRRVVQPDPGLLAENALDDLAPALRGIDRSPEATPSAHLWRGALATDLGPGEHAVEVRANIEGFGWAQARTRYRLDPGSGNDFGK